MEECDGRQKGVKTDSMDAMMTQLEFSKPGRCNDATTQKRSNGEHKYMSTRWLLMTKFNTSMEKYGGKVVPLVQVLQVKKFYFEEW